MGFLTDLVTEGFSGACSNIYWDNHYKDFCRSSGLPYLPVKTGNPISLFNKEIDNKDEKKEEQNLTTIITNIIKELSKINLSTEDVDGTKSLNPKSETCLIEVLDDKFDIQDVKNNIEEAKKKFNLSNPDDICALTTQITAILFTSGLIDSDTVFDALGQDPDGYAIVNEIVRIYSGKPMDVRLPQQNIKDTIKDCADDFAKWAAWENEFLVDHVSSSVMFNNIKESHKYILNCLEQLRAQVDTIDVDSNDITEEPKPEKSPVEVEPFVPMAAPVVTIGYPASTKQKMIKKAEAAFIDSLPNTGTYKFNVINDMMELVIPDMTNMNNLGFTHYMVDPNVLLGNGYNISGWMNKPDGTRCGVYVSSKHTDIVKKIIDGKNNYTLTQPEVQRVLADQFTDQIIYYYLDPKGLSDKVKKLNTTELKKLEQKLSVVVKHDFSKFPASRLRILSWNSMDDFVLISDEKVRAPLSDYNPKNTWGFINKGLTITVKDDQFTVKYGDNSGTYDIVYPTN